MIMDVLVILRRCPDSLVFVLRLFCPLADIWSILFFLGVVCRLTSEPARKRGDWLVNWLAVTFSEIPLIVKYDRVSVVDHSLRGVVKIQGFIVAEFWEGCNSIGTVKLEDF